MSDKKALRKEFKEKRESLFKTGQIPAISKEILEKIKARKSFIRAKNVLIFYPFGSELNILDILKEEKNFFLPRCKGEELEICKYSPGDPLIKNKYGILEPEGGKLSDLSVLDIVITPALCADVSLHRLGYGGGFYDRFFKNKDLKAEKIVIVPDCAILNEIPSDEFDVKCDVVITEKRELL